MYIFAKSLLMTLLSKNSFNYNIQKSILMKRILLLLCIMCSLCCMSQEHMKFMEISMGQKVEAFSDALKKKGFVLLSKSKTAPKGQRFFSGKFAGKQVELRIDYDAVDNDVFFVTIDFGFGMPQLEIDQLYEDLLVSLTVKYIDFKMKDSLESVMFNSEIGGVVLYFKQNSQEQQKIILNYCDMINLKKNRERKTSEVYNDI